MMDKEIEMLAAYERIEELKSTLRLVREVIEAGEIEMDGDICLNAIDDALDDGKVILAPA